MDKWKNLSKIKYWGASTSAHQVEGGNHNQWSVWELENASELAANAETKFGSWLPIWDEVKDQAQKPENYVSGIATDHYNRYEADFDLLKSFNMNAYRFSIEWSRIEPEEGKWDQEAIDHYKKYLKALKSRKIEPFVTLWHWTMPVWFVEKGDFEKRSNIQYFVRFASKVTEELGDHFKYMIIFNEPNVYMGNGYLSGEWPPSKRNRPLGIMVYQNLISAHKKAYEAVKQVNSEMLVGTSNQNSHIEKKNKKIATRVGAWGQRTFWNRWFADRTKGYNDFIGLNYYFTDHWDGTKWEGGVKPRPNNPSKKRSDYGWQMLPGDIQFVIEELYERYDAPVIVTENGLADKDDKYRKWWLEETLKAMDKAIENGAEIDGYLHWSLLDNFEWADGFWPKFGLVEVNYKTLARTPRKSATWFAQQIEIINKT